MKIKYNLERLKAVIDDICEIIDISILVSDTKYNTIYKRNKKNDTFCYKVQETETGRMKCRHSDMEMLKRCAEEKRAVSHICHAGVLDTAVPILKDGIVAGYIILGRVRLQKSSVNIKELLRWTDEPAQIEKHYKKLTYLSQRQLDSVIHLLSHILFENAIEIDYDEFINYATNYIENNLAADLSIERLCKAFHMSKNSLYKSFRDFYGCTVNEYVTRRRLEYAKAQLYNTDEKIEAIAQSAGFGNDTYFSKLFKKHTGLSPSAYRKRGA